jgi:hypothetical protein
MNILIKILVTLTILCTLLIITVTDTAKSFLRDAIELHGSNISGATVTVKDIDGFWTSRTININQIIIDDSSTAQTAPLVTIATAHIQWQKELSPDFSKDSLLPTVLPVDDLVLKNITIVFDAGSEGKNLTPLKKNIASAANYYLKQRLNATANTTEATTQLFTFQTIKLQNIKVDVKNRNTPSFQKSFDLPDMQLTAVGISEEGLSFPEVIGAVSKKLDENLYQSALANGVIQPIAVSDADGETTSTKRSNISRESTDGSSETKPKDGKIKQSVKTVGEGFKTIGRGFKKLFQ